MMRNPFRIPSKVIQDEFIPQINTITDMFKDHILPSIDNDKLNSEAEEIAEKMYQAYMSLPGTGNEDPANFASMALDEGISYFSLRFSIRQGVLNLFAVALYHTFEQQFQLGKMDDELKLRKITRDDFPSWRVIKDELRLVANTVKHAEGPSAKQLFRKRPDLFKNPMFINPHILFNQMSWPPIFQPLVGEGLYIKLSDIEYFHKHLICFWSQLAAQLETSKE